jgi:UDP:flavonoid glycosyltransferase YjiC (YdhE family)
MRLTFIAFGTRGDVQPAIALGQALQTHGHHVRLLASAHFKPWIESHGLEAAETGVDVQAVMESEGGQDWVEHGTNPLRQLRVMKALLDKSGWAMMTDAWNACRDARAEVVVSSFTSDLYAVSIAEKLKARHLSLALQPSLIATRSGAATINAPLPNRESALNYLFGKTLIETMPKQIWGAQLNRFREQMLGLSAQTYAQNLAARKQLLVVHGYSPRVVPHPPDWPRHYHTTGYWFLDESNHWSPPPELEAFIAAGEPPVCLGFGSMTGRDPARITRLVAEAVQLSGRRAILLAGWAGLGAESLPPTIFRLDAAPHTWLYPRMAAVIHHGGAGTLAAGLRAGRPTVVVPHFADQPYWGARVHALGVGPQPIPRPQLTAQNLGEAIRLAATDPALKKRATELGAAIRAEDGIARAVALIEDYL